MLQERFGAQVRQRLTDLHQLVRFEIDDRQVREDARLAFGIGKLARAWLPRRGSWLYQWINCTPRHCQGWGGGL